MGQYMHTCEFPQILMVTGYELGVMEVIVRSAFSRDATDQITASYSNTCMQVDKKLHEHLMFTLSPPLEPSFFVMPWLLTLCSQVSIHDSDCYVK